MINWMPWRRHRRREPELTPRQLADAWQLCSLVLDYPTPALRSQLPMLTQAAASLPEPVRFPLAELLDHLGGRAVADLQAEYVDTFDVTRKCSLHLTYYTHGDTRRRGVALVQFKQAYRRAGVVADETELPDHLPVLLEFGAAHDQAQGWKLLNDHRVGIELLHRALTKRHSPWLGAILALRATLPVIDADDEMALQKLIAEGPPSEQVGLGYGDAPLDPALAPPTGPVDLGSTIGVGGPR